MSALNSKSRRSYTFEEEVWSCAIHGLGIVLSIAGLTTLVALAARYRDVWTVVSTAVFGVSMIVLYTASTIYHAVPNLDLKRHLKKFDHISIYYLIAGSYTPFLLVCMRGTLGWTIFGIIWALALTGTILKLLSSGSGTKVLVYQPLSDYGLDDCYCFQTTGRRPAPNRPEISGFKAAFSIQREFCFMYGKAVNIRMQSGTDLCLQERLCTSLQFFIPVC